MGSLFVVIFVVSLGLLSKCEGDLIGDLCSRSNNPSLCNQVLRSDPRSGGSDARGLAEIAVENAESSTKSAINVAKSVVNGGNKNNIDTCIENFNNAVGTLEDSKPLIRKGDRGSIGDLKTKGSAVLTDLNTCADDFPNEPTQLKEATARAYTISQLFLIIVNTY
ncbi:hypothetical protein C2S53_008377 [Perilla frutescens var. hirtella]|uniref:Pectinesterase inhibitor domain-containing protein n=1 Tax=Perilla frutescens var. hirtella TaxID=608512 RepID=A0AAD4P9I3_PERFH|nr:hypothetical protein C2S53_008377 [Perilla frutescens var. hirtella]